MKALPKAVAEGEPPTIEGSYGFKSEIRWLATLSAPVVIGLGIWVGRIPFLGFEKFSLSVRLVSTSWCLAWAALVIGGAILGIAKAWIERILIDHDSLSQKNLFGLRVFPFESIAGIRIKNNENTQFLLFVSKDPKGKKLKLSDSLEGWPEIVNWATYRFGNLDEIEATKNQKSFWAKLKSRFGKPFVGPQ